MPQPLFPSLIDHGCADGRMGWLFPGGFFVVETYLTQQRLASQQFEGEKEKEKKKYHPP